ncbi:carboxypeptidase regulatory-like domain-containing protein [Pyxidicoccus parkwayensis]|uniref:Carboxypeptidase regulatory-like domain-containing protein n=2 Tax=Pyxidicoccus parkwayensis TaxID=2813578 RepID=A0ABX7PC50_9BACT|nr:carboxypeptidase regulatory-like domain-containing protein [Pyxidicoccus parkwaysis]
MAFGLLGALAACGGFNNVPLESGTVRGRIVGAEADVAMVSVLGQPELRAGVDPEGRFELANVPATTVELFVVASRTRAARSKVVAQGARVTDVGDIQPGPGAFITVRVSDGQGGVPSRAEVEVDGTVLDDIKVDATSGEVRVGPLPAGCYELEVKADDVKDVKEDVCVREGEELVRDIVMRSDDDGGGDDRDGGHGGRDGGSDDPDGGDDHP